MFMDTLVKKITPESLALAKRLIEEEQLVAFPTETVYGLGALATSEIAIKRVYEVKGRPSDNPLIVHVHKDYDISKLVEVNENGYAKKIAKAFTPGPLTMVYKSKKRVASSLSCGLETLAIRVPQSKEAQEFLTFVNQPIAAPSANISKHISPVTAQHVYQDFNGAIPLILDGGRCQGGIESTVLDVTGEVPVILRKGLITAEMIKQVVGACEYAEETVTQKAKSPGMKYSHYTPNCSTALFERNEIEKGVALYEELEGKGKKAVFLVDEEIALLLGSRRILHLGATGEQMASNLYDLLHEGEKYDCIITFKLNLNSELMLSVNNRFSKAFFKAENKK
ncbi:MAG: threonylcarbamoyl-AMP synthase [Clostridiales bacterium]|nr:threonylcarbamoyl-AMP synthase [Clostridiales bacterium]